MKIHIVTIGKPRLAYAQLGFADYVARLQRLHDVTVNHLADKYANDSVAILQAAPGYRVALEINGQQLTSPQLADWLAARGRLRRRAHSEPFGHRLGAGSICASWPAAGTGHQRQARWQTGRACAGKSWVGGWGR